MSAVWCLPGALGHRGTKHSEIQTLPCQRPARLSQGQPACTPNVLHVEHRTCPLIHHQPLSTWMGTPKICGDHTEEQRSLSAAFGCSLTFFVLTEPRGFSREKITGQALWLCLLLSTGRAASLPKKRQPKKSSSFKCYSCSNPLAENQTHNWITCSWYEDVALPARAGWE